MAPKSTENKPPPKLGPSLATPPPSSKRRRCSPFHRRHHRRGLGGGDPAATSTTTVPGIHHAACLHGTGSPELGAPVRGVEAAPPPPSPSSCTLTRPRNTALPVPDPIDTSSCNTSPVPRPSALTLSPPAPTHPRRRRRRRCSPPRPFSPKPLPIRFSTLFRDKESSNLVLQSDSNKEGTRKGSIPVSIGILYISVSCEIGVHESIYQAYISLKRWRIRGGYIISSAQASTITMKSNRARRRDIFRQVTIAAAGNRDRLSKLPNDVLLNILERMDTLDAIRACIVSKQMLKLPAMLSQIIIVLGNSELLKKNGVVADVTGKILSKRSPQITVRKLKVKLFLTPNDCHSVGKSVGLAMVTQKFDAAEFEILTLKNSYHCKDADLLNFASQFNTFLADCPDAFSGLTRLQLQNLRFGESDIPNILSTCKRLESLSFFECDAGIQSVLRVEHAALIELDISYGHFKTVQLDCLPKLQQMSYIWMRYENPLVLGFVPQLSRLRLTNGCLSDKTILLSQQLANVSSVSNLYLDFRSEKIWIRPECPRVLAPLVCQLRFVNLDHLREECDIAWTMFLLEAAPFVEELCITVWDHKCGKESQKSYSKKTDVKWVQSATNFKHKNLAKLTIYGFQSDVNFTGYIRRVMEAAVNIKEVSLHGRKVCKICTDRIPHLEVRPSTYPRSFEEKDSIRKKITESLVMTASPAVIHFLS